MSDAPSFVDVLKGQYHHAWENRYRLGALGSQDVESMLDEIVRVHERVATVRAEVTRAGLALEAAQVVDGSTSDGDHTFDELYEYRLLYNAALFNELALSHPEYGIHKSWRHHDGELCFGGGWFIVSAQLPTGQISNHYRTDEWGLFAVDEEALAAEWDGHGPAEAASRLRAFVVGQSA